MRKEIVVGLELGRDGLTGEAVPVGIAAVMPDNTVERYDGMQEAADKLAKAGLPIAHAMPAEEGWDRMLDLPPLMRKKLERLVGEMRASDVAMKVTANEKPALLLAAALTPRMS